MKCVHRKLAMALSKTCGSYRTLSYCTKLQMHTRAHAHLHAHTITHTNKTHTHTHINRLTHTQTQTHTNTHTTQLLETLEPLMQPNHMNSYMTLLVRVLCKAVKEVSQAAQVGGARFTKRIYLCWGVSQYFLSETHNSS